MLEFHETTRETLEELKPYFAVQNTHISDFSLGFQFMWHKMLSPHVAFAGDCLVLREYYTGRYYFHYPLSRSGDRACEDAALDEIERYCRDHDMRLHYTNVPRARLGELVLRYGADVTVRNPRRWRDYLYEAESFLHYAGGKYAGQRNHVNKFLKKYPDWAFHVYREEDKGALRAFLQEYESAQRSKGTFLAEEEMNEVYEILGSISALGLLAGYLTVGGKIVACAMGERCGDMIVVHVEKALREYEGAYPFVAQQFARAFCMDGVRFLNRMDDAGDGGLRKSKLQYLPCELVDKYTVIPKRAIDAVSRPPELEGERIILKPVRDEDGEQYRRLAADTVRNRYWGYDYRNDRKTARTPSAKWFLSLAREDFHHRNEMPLGIYAGGVLVGEAVLHRFGYRGEAEVGVRLLPEYEGQGYAREAIRLYARYAFLQLGIERLEAKCYRENERSGRMLLGAGMRETEGDETFRRFFMTASM